MISSLRPEHHSLANNAQVIKLSIQLILQNATVHLVNQSMQQQVNVLAQLKLKPTMLVNNNANAQHSKSFCKTQPDVNASLDSIRMMMMKLNVFQRENCQRDHFTTIEILLKLFLLVKTTFKDQPNFNF